MRAITIKIDPSDITHRNPVAKELANMVFRQRTVKSKKVYNRKKKDSYND